MSIEQRLRILVIEPDIQVAGTLIRHGKMLGHTVEWYPETQEKYHTVYDLVIASWLQPTTAAGEANFAKWCTAFAQTPLALAVEPQDIPLAAARLSPDGRLRYILRPYIHAELEALFGCVGQKKRLRYEAREESLKRLYDISTHLSANDDSTLISQLIVNHLTELLGAETSASINVFNRHEKSIQVLVAAGKRPREHLFHPPRPDGLIARARYMQKPLIWSDSSDEITIHPTGQEDGVQSVMVVPLLEGSRVWGALYVDTIGKRLFTTADLQTAQFFGNQTVIALRNARYVQQLLAMNEIAELLTREQDLRSLLNRLCREAIRLFDSDSACILLVEEEAEEPFLRIWGAYGLKERHIRETRERLGESIAGWVAQKGEALIDNDTVANGRLFNPAAEEEGILAIASVPIWRESKVIGTLDIHSKTRTNVFTEDDLRVLELMARQVSIAISNIRYRAGLKTLFTVGTEIVATSDESTMLQKIVNALVDTLGYSIVYFRLLERNGYLPIYASAGASHNYVRQRAYAINLSKTRITRSVFETGMPAQVYDLRKAPHFQFPLVIERENVRGLLIVPLTFENQTIGTLACYTAQPYRFKNDEIRQISTFANLATVALINRQQLNKLHRLEQASKTLAHVTQLTDVQEKVAKHIWHIFEAEGAFVCLYDSVSKRFELENAFTTALGSGAVVWKNQAASSITGERKLGRQVERLLSEEVVLVSNVQGETERIDLGKGVQRKLLDAGIYSFIGLRLQAGDELMGLLFLNYSTPYHRQLRQDEIDLLKIYADQAALTIARARMFARQQQEQTLLQSVARATSSMQDVDNVWREILLGAMAITKAETGNISLVDEAAGTITLVFRAGEQAQHFREQFVIDGNSIQGWVAIHKKAALVRNVHTQEPWRHIYYLGLSNTISELTVPIKSGNLNKVIGIINLESPREGAFQEDDVKLLEQLAVHADIAVQNARLYELSEQHSKDLVALYEASQAIAKAGLDIQAVLSEILTQAVQVTGAHHGTLYLYEEEALQVTAAWPPDRLMHLKEKLGHLYLDGPSVSVRAFNLNSAQLVPDVNHDPDFVKTDQTNSALAVVLRQNGDSIGVLNVEHRDVGGLNEDNKKTLMALSNLASFALHNAKQHQELQKTKGDMLASEAVAWLGLFGAEWQHTINQKTFSIYNYTNGLRRGLTNAGVSLALRDEVEEALLGIESVVRDIRTVQFAQALPTEMPWETNERTALDQELRQLISRWGREDKNIILHFEMNCDNSYVRIRPRWLKMAMKKLVFNAFRAMPNGGGLTIETQLVGDKAHIMIRDTGYGIPEAVRSYFLKRMVPRDKRRSNGTGMGALIAYFITRSHGGNLVLDYSSPENGTQLRMSLPLVREKGEKNEFLKQKNSIG